MRCLHCYPDAGKAQVDELSTSHAHHVIGILDELDVQTIIFGGGEPSLRPDIVALAEDVLTRDIDLIMCTNATRLSESFLDSLPRSDQFGLAVGLDGATATTNDRFRGQAGAFDRTVTAIRQATAKGLHVMVDFTATRINAHEFAPLVALAERIGVYQVNLKRFVPAGRGKANLAELLLTPSDYRVLLHTWEDVRRSARIAVGAHEPLTNSVSMEPSASNGCLAGRFWVGLGPNGDIWPCPLLCTLASPIGNILRDPPWVWLSHTDMTCLHTRWGLPGRCGTCRYTLRCGGCRATAYAITGDLLADDPYCDMWAEPDMGSTHRSPARSCAN
jgi:radical SAM protein with 4Fe4S-binding SPASM domain